MYIIIIANGVRHVRHAHLHCAKASRFFDSFGHGHSMQGPQRTPSAIRQGEKLKLGPFLSEKKELHLMRKILDGFGWYIVQPCTTPSPYHQSTGLLNTAHASSDLTAIQHARVSAQRGGTGRALRVEIVAAKRLSNIFQ